jgi:dihydrofolate reductase
MITLVFMTDPQRVVGGSTRLRNMLRVPFPPISELSPAMERAMKGEHMVIGSGGAGFYAERAINYRQAWLLTRRKSLLGLKPGLTICNDLGHLVRHYKTSDDELLVLGGLSLWQSFLPHAQSLRVVETLRGVPGNLRFDEWDCNDFESVSESPGERLVERRYERRRLRAATAWN